MSRIVDAFLVLLGRAEIVMASEIVAVEQFLHTEEKEIEKVITDALNNLANAIQAVLAERSTDKAALAQAEADRDGAMADSAEATSERNAAQAALTAAQSQLADAENQINALIAQINPPA